MVSPETDVIGHTISSGNWLVYPVQCYHNVECFGYIIRNKLEHKDILFCTDSREFPKVADRPFDLMMLECNYDYDTVIENSQNSKLLNDGYKHHMALETLVQWLKVRECKPKNLMAIHLSTTGNLNVDKATQELKDFADNFYIVKKGMEIEI